MEARCICMKMVLTFVNDPPAKSVDMLIRQLSASILVPGIMGWLFQTNSFLHPECVHMAFTVMALPVWVAVIVGLLPLQKWKTGRAAEVWTKILCIWALSLHPVDRSCLILESCNRNSVLHKRNTDFIVSGSEIILPLVGKYNNFSSKKLLYFSHSVACLVIGCFALSQSLDIHEIEYYLL